VTFSEVTSSGAEGAESDQPGATPRVAVSNDHRSPWSGAGTAIQTMKTITIRFIGWLPEVTWRCWHPHRVVSVAVARVFRRRGFLHHQRPNPRLWRGELQHSRTPLSNTNDFAQDVNRAKSPHKYALWVAASAATLNDLKNKGFSPW